MRLLFLDAYYKPEKIAFTHLENDLIEGFVAAGHEIDIICPIPTRGVDMESKNRYRKSKYEEEYDGKVRVHRFWAPQEGSNPIVRAFRYAWCNLRTYQLGKKFKETDVIFANSTPPTQGWLAGKLKKKIDCKFLYSLQDIFPDSLVTTDLWREESIIYKLGSKIANSAYETADSIIVISQAFKKNIIEKGVPESKIKLVYNWVDTDEVKPVRKIDNRLFDELRISRDVPTVVYAGNFGASQNGGIIIEAAKALQDENVQFVLFGGGSEYPAIRKRVEDEAMTNVYCFDLMPLSRVSEVYSLGDIVLITNAPGVGDCGMPSKLWSIMATNAPIIASIDPESELADVIRNHAGGHVSKAGDVESFCEAILHAIKTIKSVDSYAYVKANADKKSAVHKYKDALDELKR